MMHYCDYLAVEDWEVIATKTCYFYNDEATPFEAVCVKIGTMTNYKTTINGSQIDKCPILRWISRGEYETLNKNSGVIVF